jgi:O-antigen ligase
MPIFEVLASVFLIWNSFVPFQNYGEMSHFWLAGIVLWIVALCVWRSKHLFSTSLLFHLTLIIAYYLRADFSEGWFHNWLFWLAVVQWAVVLWLAAKRPENRVAPSIFLMISFIAPLLFSVLNVTDRTTPGFALFSLLVLRVAWLNRDSLSFPKPLILFLLLCLISIPFSFYSWHNYQFFILNCVCVLLYSISQYKDNREAFLLGYLNLSLMLISFALVRELYSFWQIGASALRMRLAIYAHHDDLAPLFIILSCLMVGFARDFRNRPLRILLVIVLILLAALEALTYSRNGWLDYVVFAVITGLVLMTRKKFVTLAAVSVAVLAIVLFVSPDIRNMVKQRVRLHDPSFGSRAYDMQIGLKTVKDHPLFGVGWLNFYTHTRQIKSEPLKNVGKSLVVPIQSHSVFVNMSEAGGVLLGVLFFFILGRQLDFRRAAVFSAGLVAVILNCLVDSACFWLPVYIHVWILCGIIQSHASSKPAGRTAWIPSAVLALFVLSFLLPILEDRFLYESVFYLKNNEIEKALQKDKWARWTAPLDVEPLQHLRDIYLSSRNEKDARLVLNRLIQLKKDYAPYYSDLAAIERRHGNLEACQKYLMMAKGFDPQGALGVSTYLTLGALQQEQGKVQEFNDTLSLALLLPQNGRPMLQALPLLNGLNQDRFLHTVLAFAAKNAPSADDWSAAVLNFYYNLMYIEKAELAEKLIPGILANRKNMYPEDVDDFCLFLANLYAERGDTEKIRPLIAYCTRKGALRITARLNLLEKKFPEAEKTLRSLLQYYEYQTLQWGWEALYIGTNNKEDLRGMYRILERLPSADANALFREEIAASYVEESAYRKAATEYRQLSFYDYSDPAPHWREARFWWLAGEEQKAEAANTALQRLIPQNVIYANLYKSDIDTIAWQGTCIVRQVIPNDLGGMSYRTGIFFHPPAKIVLPANVQLRSIQGELGIVGNAWTNERDGATFSVCALTSDCFFNRTVNPKENPQERGWNPFSWVTPTPRQVMLKSDYGIDNRYDWLVLVVNKAE